MKKSLAQLTSIISLVLLLCLSMNCLKKGELGITEEEAKTLGDRYIQARNEVNLDLLDDVYFSDVVVHDCSSPEDIVGLDALKKYYSFTHKAFPDLQATIDETIVKGDRIIWIWTFRGTNTGPLHTPMGDLPPTDKKVKFSGVAIDRVENGKVVEEWVYFNVLDLLQQLGFTLAPPQPTQPEGK